MCISKLIAGNRSPRAGFRFGWLPNKEPEGRGPLPTGSSFGNLFQCQATLTV